MRATAAVCLKGIGKGDAKHAGKEVDELASFGLAYLSRFSEDEC